MSLLLLFHGSGTSGDISGSATITFSQTGNLKGSGALLGSTTVTFSQSGLLRGSGALLGSTTITFSQSGLLRGSGALVGTTSILFSPSATINGLAFLVASTSILFSCTATIQSTFTVPPFTGTDKIGAHEYFPWHNKDGISVYFNKGGHHRKRYFPRDIERQDVIVRKELSIANPTTIQELDWDVYNYFEVDLNADVEFVFSNPRDNSDFVLLLTKDANATVRNITWPASLAWPNNDAFTTLVSSGETKLLRISYFGGRYRATIY